MSQKAWFTQKNVLWWSIIWQTAIGIQMVPIRQLRLTENEWDLQMKYGSVNNCGRTWNPGPCWHLDSNVSWLFLLIPQLLHKQFISIIKITPWGEVVEKLIKYIKKVVGMRRNCADTVIWYFVQKKHVLNVSVDLCQLQYSTHGRYPFVCMCLQREVCVYVHVWMKKVLNGQGVLSVPHKDLEECHRKLTQIMPHFQTFKPTKHILVLCYVHLTPSVG